VSKKGNPITRDTLSNLQNTTRAIVSRYSPTTILKDGKTIQIPSPQSTISIREGVSGLSRGRISVWYDERPHFVRVGFDASDQLFVISTTSATLSENRAQVFRKELEDAIRLVTTLNRIMGGECPE